MRQKGRKFRFQFTLTRLQLALWAALGPMILAPTLQAQIVVDSTAPGSQQPTVLEAANGVPLVNIQTPSSAGVSRNTYQQFDIHAPGAILNNANTSTQTQLGGWVQGNPHLAQNTARVILNEVNSRDPSQLHGRLEIAGQSAELVIANPAGIICNGCGFINAYRTTLTTGTPIMHGGHLEGYRVHGGHIAITGLGMDASATDYTTLIARSVAVNADLWAQQLQIISGTNEVSAEDRPTITAITSNKNTPIFALDVSALGGMYAQKILLRGTEHGVGVRNAGMIGAQAGELVVTSEGRLENRGQLYAHTAAKLAANEMINSGLISANQALSAEISQTIDNQNGQLFSANTLHLNSKNLNNNGGLLYAEKELTAHIVDSIDNQQGLLFAQQTINLTSGQIVNQNTNNAQQGIQGKNVLLSAQHIDNTHGMIVADQILDIAHTKQLNNHYGYISSAKTINISAKNIHNDHGILLADQLLDITADNLIGNGKLLSKDDINLTLQHNFIHTGEITANGRAELRTINTLDNRGKLQASDLYIHGKQIHNAENGVLYGNRNSVIADNMLENRGIIDGGITYIKSRTLDNIGSGRIYGDQLSLSADTLFNHKENNQTAVIAARERLNMGINSLFNQEHALIFSAASSVNALNIGGYLDENKQANGQATLIRNDSATIESLGDLTIKTQSLFNTNVHFLTETRQIADPQRYLYIQPSGQANKQTVDNFHWEKWDHAGRYRHKETGQEIKDWTQFDVIQTEYETQVTFSDPALIRAGGDITLLGQMLTNDKSHILAGGVLHGDLDRLDNIDGLGENSVHQIGTSQYTRSNWRGGFKRYFERDWHSKVAYTPADEVKTIRLDVVKTEQNTSNQGSGFNVSNRQAIQHVNHARTIEVNLAIPNNNLFNTVPNTHYWIETDPRFTDYKQWLSSDYMLDQLGIDPSAVHKRLGDGFYEQQLIRDQIGQLTGRRFLDGHANDENQYRALLESGVTFAKAWNLQPGIALSAEQMAQLTSDIVWLVNRDIHLPDGTTTTALVPQVYVRVQPDDVDGRGTLLAADRINLNLNADLINSGTIAGRTALHLNSDNLRNIGGYISGKSITINTHNDLDNIGGIINSDNSLLLHVGRDLNVSSTTHSDEKQAEYSDFSRTHIDRIASIYVNQGDLVASAARDINLTAAHIINKDGSTALLAGGDLNINTIQIAEHENNIRDAHNYLKQSSTQDMGTRIQTHGDIYLHAKQNLTATAANIRSEQGTIQASAEGDVSIQSGQASIRLDEAHSHKNRGLLGSKQTTTHDFLEKSQTIGSTFSGENVIIQGKNITVTGSNIVSDNNTILSAKNNLTIKAATEIHAESHSKEVTRKGMLYNGGMALTIGKQSQHLDKQDTHTYATASTIGSIQGDVFLSAGNHYQQIGSHVAAPKGDIDIHAKNVEIVEARETSHSAQAYTFNQSGLSIALSAPVVSAIQTGQQMVNAVSKTNDARVQTLAAVTTGFAATDAYKALQADPKTGGGISISVTYGKSESSNQSTMENNIVAGSAIIAGGDVRISATGSTDSNITVRGSDINADGNVTLKADGEINLLAAKNTVETTRRSHSSSSGAGLAISVGQNGFAFGVTANASRGKGEGEGRDTIWSNTHINAGEQLILESGVDTNLRGAIVSGKQVIATIGGDLNIESLQDTSTFHSKDTHMGGSATVGYGVSGSVSYSNTKVEGDFASVREYSGIQAGDNGFQINVKGNTDLKGGVIASTDQAVEDSFNYFNTNTLTTSDIENYSRYKASGASFSGGFSFSNNKVDPNAEGIEKSGETTNLIAENNTEKNNSEIWGKLVNGLNGTGVAGRSKDSGNDYNANYSGISGGAIQIRNESAQQALTGKSAEETITGLNRDILTSNTVDEISRKAETEITKAFSQYAYTMANEYIQSKGDKLWEELKQLHASEELSGEKNARIVEISEEFKQLSKTERLTNILLGAATGEVKTATTKEGLSISASLMREWAIKDSEQFAGVVDVNNTDYVINNKSGKSIGVRWDGKKIGGTRIDLDIICGRDNSRCKMDPSDPDDKTFLLDDNGMVQFKGVIEDKERNKIQISLDDFLHENKEGRKSIGITGGIQGDVGTLNGKEYSVGSIEDKLVEAFAGTHDTIGGKLVGLYDRDGNARRNRPRIVEIIHEIWSDIAIIPSTPFALSELLSSNAWNATDIIFKSTK